MLARLKESDEWVRSPLLNSVRIERHTKHACLADACQFLDGAFVAPSVTELIELEAILHTHTCSSLI